MSLVKVEVVRAKLLEQKFKLYFRVDNRDDADLTVRGLIYKVTLGDFVLTEGESNEWLTVPPRSHKFSGCRCAPTSGRRSVMWCRC